MSRKKEVKRDSRRFVRGDSPIPTLLVHQMHPMDTKSRLRGEIFGTPILKQ